MRCILLISIALIPFSSTRAGEPAAVWKATRTLAAPEANQAAAADGRFVYAITNDRVAKYDRESGKLLAVSTGEAQHLNSGFLCEGRLYCAHSNYPKTPEQSEIKRLDPESMQLRTFHDFGNFGGSLTWVLRQEGHWWCNFARYGRDNAQTFLVKLDDNWQETGRWIYPAELIAKLGNYSLSGGVWREGDLLVTGHDDPVVFRLRLPKAGKVLELIDTQTVPFTGQGIAQDPATGALVGINRAKRQVVLAELPDAPLRIRVLTYNLHHGEGVDGKLDLERIARVIRDAQPDIVALQELDRSTNRTGKVDQPAELARLTGLQATFGGNIALQGGEYGNAVLSRWPVRRKENHSLPRLDQGEQRGVLELEIELPDGRPPLLMLATHLDHRPANRERIESAEAINRLAAAHPEMPALLAGDLNDIPDSRTLREFGKQWIRANADVLPTIPVEQPKHQIDYVLFRPAERWRVLEARVLDEATASDHRPLLAVLELLPAGRVKSE